MLKVLFMGTPDFAKESLENLYNATLIYNINLYPIPIESFVYVASPDILIS